MYKQLHHFSSWTTQGAHTMERPRRRASMPVSATVTKEVVICMTVVMREDPDTYLPKAPGTYAMGIIERKALAVLKETRAEGRGFSIPWVKAGRYHMDVKLVSERVGGQYGDTPEWTVAVEILTGPRAPRPKPAPLPKLKDAVARVRQGVTQITIPTGAKFILVYDQHMSMRWSAHRTLNAAWRSGQAMSRSGMGWPLAIVHDGIMNYWLQSILVQAPLKRHIRQYRLSCEQRGVQVRRVGMQLPNE